MTEKSNIEKQLEKVNLGIVAMASQLIKIEKDLRKLNETMLIQAIQEIRLNRLTQKTLQVQFNVMDISDVEIDKEFSLLKEQVHRLAKDIKNVSELVSLPPPDD